jgi:hypothetical protein
MARDKTKSPQADGTRTRRAKIDAAPEDAPPGWQERFGGKLWLVLLDNKYSPSVRGGRSLWALQRTLSYRPSNDDHTITVARGFVTDLTSVPRVGWMLLPPDGPWVKAAVIHDFLYATEGDGKMWDHEGNTRPTPYTRKEADWILRDALQNRGVGWVTRNIIWLAVRIGGSLGWGRTRSKAKRMTSADEAEIERLRSE